MKKLILSLFCAAMAVNVMANPLWVSDRTISSFNIGLSRFLAEIISPHVTKQSFLKIGTFLGAAGLAGYCIWKTWFATPAQKSLSEKELLDVMSEAESLLMKDSFDKTNGECVIKKLQTMVSYPDFAKANNFRLRAIYQDLWVKCDVLNKRGTWQHDKDMQTLREALDITE